MYFIATLLSYAGACLSLYCKFYYGWLLHIAHVSKMYNECLCTSKQEHVFGDQVKCAARPLGVPSVVGEKSINHHRQLSVTGTGKNQ